MSDIVMYTATGCPLCERYRTMLTERGLRFQERNTTEQPGLLDDLAKLGIRMVPTVFVGSKYVAGFRPASLEEILPV